nr:flagellar biosynthetic protein FliR [uncultured Brachyspira sp.]
MMDNFVNFFQIYLLIMVRLTAILMVAPLFSSNVIPNTIKMALSFITTAAIFPLAANINVQAAPTFAEYFLTLLNEALIGILIGFLMSIIFAAYQVMANFFEIQMGFGISETVDPISQVTVPVLGQMQSLIVILLFIAIDGPSLIIRTLFYSFKAMPILSNASKAVFMSSFNGIIDRMIYYMSSLFSIALSLALPIMLTLFLLSLSLGLLAKAAPQMNILMLGFPMQITVGITAYYILIPVLVSNFMKILQSTIADVNNIITFLSGGTI